MNAILLNNNNNKQYQNFAGLGIEIKKNIDINFDNIKIQVLNINNIEIQVINIDINFDKKSLKTISIYEYFDNIDIRISNPAL